MMIRATVFLISPFISFPQRKTRYSQNPPVEMHVGWIMDSREHPARLRNDSISEENDQLECGSQAGSLGSRYVWPMKTSQNLLVSLILGTHVFDQYTLFLYPFLLTVTELHNRCQLFSIHRMRYLRTTISHSFSTRNITQDV